MSYIVRFFYNLFFQPLGSIENLSSKALRSATCSRNPEILCNTKYDCTESGRIGVRQQVARPRPVNCQRPLILWCLLFFIWHPLALADIAVQIQPPAVRLGQVFHLNFTIEGSQRVGVPDLTPLQKDFTIIGTERSTAYSMMNGQTQSMIQWMVLLTAKRAGVLPIPAIQFGAQQSAATHIEVSQDPLSGSSDAPSADLPDEVMLKIEVDKDALLVNEQLIYTVKLYNSQRLLDAQYVPPQVENALMVPLGDGRRYDTTLDGQHYSVEEQQYAIFPQKSGQLKIIPPEFSALIFETVPRRMTAHAKTIQIPVKHIPAKYRGTDWLPAKQMALTEIYDQHNDTLQEGSTLIRKVTIQASGVPAQLLPTLHFSSQDDFNVYAEKPELQNIARQKQLIGRADVKLTYILNKAGEVTIPAIAVPWFNTETGKEESVSLPARTIHVQAKIGLTAPKVPSADVPVDQRIPEAKSMSRSQPSQDYFAWSVAALLGTAWFLTLAIWGYKKTHWAKRRSQTDVLKDVHAACRHNDPKQAEAALRRWAAIQFAAEDLLNLYQIERWVQDPLLKKELSRLSQVLYRQHITSHWQGESLWERIKNYQHPRSFKKNKNRDLPPINPS